MAQKELASLLLPAGSPILCLSTPREVQRYGRVQAAKTYQLEHAYGRDPIRQREEPQYLQNTGHRYDRLGRAALRRTYMRDTS